MNDDSSSGGGEILEMLLVCEFCSNSCSLIIESMEFFLFCIFQKPKNTVSELIKNHQKTMFFLILY